MTCKTCSGDTAGYKCDVCGEESAEQDAAHACGAEHSTPKCAACNEADGKCTCAPAAPVAPEAPATPEAPVV